jgi:hypothetical protein
MVRASAGSSAWNPRHTPTVPTRSDHRIVAVSLSPRVASRRLAAERQGRRHQGDPTHDACGRRMVGVIFTVTFIVMRGVVA